MSGLEPMTPCMSSRYSNQLSYTLTTESIIAQIFRFVNPYFLFFSKIFFAAEKYEAALPAREAMLLCHSHKKEARELRPKSSPANERSLHDMKNGNAKFTVRTARPLYAGQMPTYLIDHIGNTSFRVEL